MSPGFAVRTDTKIYTETCRGKTQLKSSDMGLEIMLVKRMLLDDGDGGDGDDDDDDDDDDYKL